MVSKARLDLPEPDRPVITTSRSRGISTSIFFRLCSRAPRTTILVSMSGRLGGNEEPSIYACRPRKATPNTTSLFFFRSCSGLTVAPFPAWGYCRQFHWPKSNILAVFSVELGFKSDGRQRQQGDFDRQSRPGP